MWLTSLQPGNAIFAMVFQEQAEKWSLHANYLMESAIIIVHRFIYQLMEDIFENPTVRRELQDLANDKILKGYRRAWDHKDFLVKMELDYRCQTYNLNMDAAVGMIGRENFRTSLIKSYQDQRQLVDSDLAFNNAVEATFGSSGLTDNLDDLLEVYYSIAIERFLDNVCRQAVSYFLLEADDSPVKVLKAEFIAGLTDSQVERIAGEDAITRRKRLDLEAELKPLEEALKALRE